MTPADDSAPTPVSTRYSRPLISIDPVKLRDLRHKHGYSHTKLSHVSGVGTSYLSALERGVRTRVSEAYARAIADALDTSIDDIQTQEDT